MKSMILIALFICGQAFAFDVCQFEDTVEFDQAVDARKIKLIAESSDHFAFTTLERQMIHITVQDGGKRISMTQALLDFGDFYGNDTEPGSNAGEIKYYQAQGKKFALVHWWPGDNEVGAFLQVMPNGKIKVLAGIGDGEISCSR